MSLALHTFKALSEDTHLQTMGLQMVGLVKTTQEEPGESAPVYRGRPTDT